MPEQKKEIEPESGLISFSLCAVSIKETALNE